MLSECLGACTGSSGWRFAGSDVQMAGRRVLATGAALAALLLAGCTAGLHRVREPAAGCARRSSEKPAPNQAAPQTSWPEPRAEPPGVALALSNQVVDPVARTAYALVSRTLAPIRGPYVLKCINLQNGLVAKGPVFRAPDLAIASGYLWILGRSAPKARALVSQVDPRSMRVIRDR